MAAFAERLESAAETTDGVRTIGMELLDQIARHEGVSRREMELLALGQGVMPRRYVRNYGTIGLDGQHKLLQSSVAVVGLGGLGGFVVEGLARMGIGRLVVVDGDSFCDHNLNRQLLSLEKNQSSPKTKAAAARVREVNRAVETVLCPFHATRENLGDLLSGVQVLVDAVDRLSTRLMLQSAASQAGIPMIHGAIGGWMGQVMTILPGDVGLRALYGEGQVPERGAEVTLGTPPASPMMVAAWQIHETVKVLLGRGSLLRDRLLFMDAESAETRTLGLKG